MIMHFRSFRLQPPHAPPSSGNASCSGRAWPPIRFVSLSAVLRTSHFSSCLISRIRPYRVCVATLVWAAVLRTIRSLPVALHPVSPRRSYFQFLAGSSAREGLSPSCARSLSSALAMSLWFRGGSSAWVRCAAERGAGQSQRDRLHLFRTHLPGAAAVSTDDQCCAEIVHRIGGCRAATTPSDHARIPEGTIDFED